MKYVPFNAKATILHKHYRFINKPTLLWHKVQNNCKRDIPCQVLSYHDLFQWWIRTTLV